VLAAWFSPMVAWAVSPRSSAKSAEKPHGGVQNVSHAVDHKCDYWGC
jgi:hypothetical protein